MGPDRKRLAEIYGEDVRWVALDPRGSCETRDDVFESFRARIAADIHIDSDEIRATPGHVILDEIRATPGHVILRGRVASRAPFVSLFTVQEGRITYVQDFETLEALETA